MSMCACTGRQLKSIDPSALPDIDQEKLNEYSLLFYVIFKKSS